MHQKLSSDHYCMVCPRQHPCLDNANLDMRSVANETFVCLSKSAAGYMYKQFYQICRGMNFTPRAVVE